MGWIAPPTLLTVWFHTTPRRIRTTSQSHEISGQKEIHPGQVSQESRAQARREEASPREAGVRPEGCNRKGGQAGTRQTSDSPSREVARKEGEGNHATRS